MNDKELVEKRIESYIQKKASYSIRILFENENIEEIKLKTIMFVNKAREILK